MNLVDNGPDDGGFVCVPGSHKYNEFWEGKEVPGRDDWYFFSDDEPQTDPLFEQSVKVCCSAGDFILWDSRTWHCNTVPKTESLRACTYVCMLPKDKVPQKIRTARAQAVIDGRVSTHHPGMGFHLFPKKPRWCEDITYNIAVTIQ
jgi:ectoine hydroxylase-related dioxygenase (phytanoyl-CoA dioxygenase family)